MKELECRLATLEARVVYLSTQKENAIDLKKSLGEEERNGELLLQIDGSKIDEIILEQLKKKQSQEKSELYIKEEFKGLDDYKRIEK